MSRVYLVRHGAVHNPDAVVYGRLPGFPLSTEGQAQARTTANHLRGLLAVPPPLILASPLLRANDTATIIGETLGATVRTDDRLIEADSAFDGLPRRFAPIQYIARYFEHRHEPMHEPPGEIASRMMCVIREALLNATDVVIVSHQFPIQMARFGFEHRIDERPARLIKRFPFAFFRVRCTLASVTTITFEEGARPPATHYWEPPL